MLNPCKKCLIKTMCKEACPNSLKFLKYKALTKKYFTLFISFFPMYLLVFIKIKYGWELVWALFTFALGFTGIILLVILIYLSATGDI